MMATSERIDGRRARRERGRRAVIEAMRALILEDGAIPDVDRIAERAGVSVSSVFRYFDGLDDLRSQMVAHHLEASEPLLELAPADGLAERIDAYVAARARMHETIAPIARIARGVDATSTAVAEGVADMRRRLVAQTREQFAPELAALAPAAADDLVVVVDSLTSFEVWDLLGVVHGRTGRQIRRAWRDALGSLLGCDPTSDGDTGE